MPVEKTGLVEIYNAWDLIGATVEYRATVKAGYWHDCGLRSIARRSLAEVHSAKIVGVKALRYGRHQRASYDAQASLLVQGELRSLKLIERANGRSIYALAADTRLPNVSFPDAPTEKPIAFWAGDGWERIPAEVAESCFSCEGTGLCKFCDGDGLNPAKWLFDGNTCPDCDGTGRCSCRDHEQAQVLP